MAYIIDNESCSACGACAEACPQGAISYKKETCVYTIDPEKCIECGACEAGCGSGAARSE